MLRVSWMAGALMGLMATGAAMAQSPNQPKADRNSVSKDVDSPMNQPSLWELSSGPMAFSMAAAGSNSYWLGVACVPAPAALQAQLNLPKQQGLLVGMVQPDSPAAKAGIAEHDILLRIGKTPLGGLRDLVQAIAASDGGPLKIELLRGGKPKTIEVVPAKHPEPPAVADDLPNAEDWEKVQKWLEGVMPGQQAERSRQPMTFRFYHPGAIVAKDVLIQKPLPANMSITISKTGNQPAKIKVQRNQETWEVTDKELGKLPPDVRPFAEMMLGRGTLNIIGRVQALPNRGPNTATMMISPRGGPVTGVVSPNQLPGQVMVTRPWPDAGASDGRIEKRLDEMNRRIDKLFDILAQMVDERSTPPKP